MLITLLCKPLHAAGQWQLTVGCNNNAVIAGWSLESCSEGCVADGRGTEGDTPHVCSGPLDCDPGGSQGGYGSTNAEAHTYDPPRRHIP